MLVGMMEIDSPNVCVSSQYTLFCDFHWGEEFPLGSHWLFNIGLKIKSQSRPDHKLQP